MEKDIKKVEKDIIAASEEVTKAAIAGNELFIKYWMKEKESLREKEASLREEKASLRKEKEKRGERENRQLQHLKKTKQNKTKKNWKSYLDGICCDFFFHNCGKGF